SFHTPSPHRALHSFPTRRSSDLTAAIIVAVLLGIPLGVFAAARQGSRFDHVVRVISLTGQSVPIFVLGLLALLVFYVKLGIAPRSEEHTSELQSLAYLVCRLLLE